MTMQISALFGLKLLIQWQGKIATIFPNPWIFFFLYNSDVRTSLRAPLIIRVINSTDHFVGVPMYGLTLNELIIPDKFQT